MQMNTNERPAWVLAGRHMVTVDLGSAGTRVGQLLVPSTLTPDTEKVTVEYLSPAGHFQCRRLRRSQIEVID